MGLFPNWLKEFPGQFIATYKQAIPENWAEFKQEVAGGVKTAVSIPAKIAVEVLKPINRPLLLIGTLLLLILIFWKKIFGKIL